MFQELINLENKAIRIINSLPFNSSSIKKKIGAILKLLKSQILYRYKTPGLCDIACFEKGMPSPFINHFQKVSPKDSKRTRSAFKPVLLHQTLTQTLRKNPIKHQYIDS